MHNIEIFCSDGHGYWIIAKMYKDDFISDGEWEQLEPASREREQEINAFEAKLRRDPERAFTIENMIKWKLNPEENLRVMREVQKERPKRDKPVSYTYILNGKNVGPDRGTFRVSPDDDLYKKYAFGCPKCHGDKKPRELRESKLTVILDGLEKLNEERISLKELSRITTQFNRM